MKKFENFKNSIKEKLEKIKNYITKNYNTIIFTIQCILTIITTILLIYLSITATKISKQLDDISKQNASIISSMNSQDSTKVESEIKTSKESTSSETTSSSTQSIITSSKPSSSESSKPITSKPASSTPTTSNSTESTSSDVDLLACVIYQEAGGNGSCDNCRRRVADVVLNRVADSRFPNTIKGVLTAKNQYGKFYYTGVVWPSRAKNSTEKAAVARAYRIAKEVLNGQHSDLYGNGYIWQAGFKQGTSHIKCCGTYFCK